MNLGLHNHVVLERVLGCKAPVTHAIRITYIIMPFWESFLGYKIYQEYGAFLQPAVMVRTSSDKVGYFPK